MRDPFPLELAKVQLALLKENSRYRRFWDTRIGRVNTSCALIDDSHDFQSLYDTESGVFLDECLNGCQEDFRSLCSGYFPDKLRTAVTEVGEFLRELKRDFGVRLSFWPYPLSHREVLELLDPSVDIDDDLSTAVKEVLPEVLPGMFHEEGIHMIPHMNSYARL